MEPSLSQKERIISTPLAYGLFVPLTNLRLPGFIKPNRGDLVIFQPPYVKPNPWYISILDPFVRFFTLQRISMKEDQKSSLETPVMAKRIIGIPGDTVKVNNFVAFIKPEGQEQFVREFELIKKEYNITPNSGNGGILYKNLLGGYKEILLSGNQYFILGDNRNGSQDSLSWGPVSFDSIKSKVILSYWPKVKFR